MKKRIKQLKLSAKTLYVLKMKGNNKKINLYRRISFKFFI